MDKSSKKGGFFRGMLDGFRSSVGSQSSPSHSSSLSSGGQGRGGDHHSDLMEDNLKSEHFEILNVVRHGFPYQPTAIAFDPIQRLIAIGTKSGSMRILGRPGVDINVQHVPGYPVIQIMFIINEGSVITVCADDSLHLWDLKQKQPTILHSLKFQRERITYCHLPFQSKWLYIGTERGNVYISNVESFMLSGYVINWNKVIELSRKTHPGCIVHLSNCPIDPNKLLIGYDSGFIVMWDLRNKSPDIRITYTEGLSSISWHHEGRQFVCSHTDGSITTWNARSPKPASVAYPHAKLVTEAMKPEPCRAVTKVEWRTVRNGDSFIIFSGGLPFSSSSSSSSTPGTPSATSTESATAAAAPPTTSTTTTTTAKSTGSSSRSLQQPNSTMSTQSLTVIHGKTTTVLEMEHNIIDFVTLCESPYESDFNEPYAVVVLLYNDLVVVDLTSPGYPCFQNPYTMDLHESPITYVSYFADCPSDLIPAFYSVGVKGNTKRSGFSDKEWPINGGEWGSATLSYPEVIVTGHADGTLKFWDASSVNLHLLYKLKTSKLFLKPKGRPPPVGSGSGSGGGNSGQSTEKEPESSSEDPFAIEQIAFCPESRILSVAGASSHVIVFRFNRQEALSDIPVIEAVMKYDIHDSEKDSTDVDTVQGISGLLRHQGSSDDSHGGSASLFFPLSVKSGQHKRPSGFQPELVCLSPWLDYSTPPYKITSLTVNSSNSLLAYGTENGLIIIDLIQKAIVLNVASPELYGNADPYQRYVKSPKRNTTAALAKDSSDGNQSDPDRCRSPTSDQSLESLTSGLKSVGTNQGSSNYSSHSLVSTPSEEQSKLISSPIDTPNDSESNYPIAPPRSRRKSNKSATTTASDNCNANANSCSSSSNLAKGSGEPLSSLDNENKSLDSAEISETSTTTTTTTVTALASEENSQAAVRDSESSNQVSSNPASANSSSNFQAQVEEAEEAVAEESCLSKCIPKATRPNVLQLKECKSQSLDFESDEVVNKEIKDGFRNEFSLDGQKRSFSLSNPPGGMSHHSHRNEFEPIGSSDGGSHHYHGGDSRSRNRSRSCSQQQLVPSPTDAHHKNQSQSGTLSESMLEESVSSTTASAASAASAAATMASMHSGKDVGSQIFLKESAKKKIKLIDLRSTSGEDKEHFSVAKLLNKIESSFSRSRSSSVSSLDNVTTEAIQCLYFAETFNVKGDSSFGLCLWLGTTLGSVIVITITLPDTEDNRVLCLQSVLAIPTGNIFRLKGSILCVSFLDNSGSLMAATCEQWKDSRTGTKSVFDDKRSGSFTIHRSSSGGPGPISANFSIRSSSSKISPTSSAADVRDYQFAVLVSEKQARVLSLPNQVCLSKATLSETSFTVRADVIQMKTPESVCLAAYLGTGNIVVYSLPSLRPLIDIDFLPLVDVRIARTLSFSTNGHGIYLSSASEIQKFCLSSSLKDLIPDMLGNLILTKELPEAPKLGFFKGLFSGGVSAVDREELFGEASGKSLKGTARLIPGSQAGMESAKVQAGSLAGEMAKVRQGLTERGENLEKLEERTARMMTEGEGFKDTAHQLLLKYKDKKWYQF